jgi:hypothetical protein
MEYINCKGQEEEDILFVLEWNKNWELRGDMVIKRVTGNSHEGH